MNPPTNGGVFDSTDMVALTKIGCIPTEIWVLNIFAEKFSEKGKKRLAQIFIQGMEKGLSFNSIMAQCQESWSDILTFSSETETHDPDQGAWGTANAWAFNTVRKNLKLDTSQPIF